MALIIELVNISAPDARDWAPDARYRYQVRINSRIIERGEVAGHTRTDGWAALVQKMLEQRPPSVGPNEHTCYRPGCGKLTTCDDTFPGMPSRWCSGCLIAALLRRLDAAKADEDDDDPPVCAQFIEKVTQSDFCGSCGWARCLHSPLSAPVAAPTTKEE